jgi:alanine or glycine:cation symporter, AGCS family
MEIATQIKEFSEKILTIPYIIVLISSIIITIKTKFIQIRMFPKMLKLFVNNAKQSKKKDELTIKSRHALFTAISTSIGIGNIVGPIVAIKLGGPGALLGFVVAVFFGAATIFAEVSLALTYRKPLADGGFAGGPMQYIKKAFHPAFAKVYGLGVALMLLAWSTSQANTLADILKTYNIPDYATGIFLAILTLVYLIGGIKKIGELSAKIVPLMFILFCTISLWIIFVNAEKLPAIFSLMFKEVFSSKALSGAGIGLLLRWGIAKGTQASEAGVGTATIPHSMSKTKDPIEQGILAMLSTYAVGFVCILSGLVVLLTDTWQSNIPMGINMLAKSFSMHTPHLIANIVLILCTFLFALGSIIGNSYNGSQGFLYVTKNRFVNWYYFSMGIIIFLGSIFSVELIWSIIDFFVIPVALTNVLAVVYLLFKRKDIFSKI